MSTSVKVVLAAVGSAGLALGVAYLGFWKPAHTRQVERIGALDAQVRDLTTTKGKLETDLAASSAKAEQLTAAMTEQNTKLGEVRTRVGELEKNVADLSSQKATTEQEKAELERKLTTAGAALDAARVELAEMVKQNGALRGEVADLQARLETASARVVALSRDLEQTTVALAAEKQARAAVEKVASDTKLLQMAVQQENAQMQQLYKQLTPVRLEQRNETLTGRKMAQKKGVPLGFIFDGIGDAFQGASEGIAGRKGPAYWVAVMPDMSQVRITDSIADAWKAKGVPVVGQPVAAVAAE